MSVDDVSSKSRMLRNRWLVSFVAGLFALGLVVSDWSFAQQTKRRPTRSKPPALKDTDFEDVFFTDVKKQLQGEKPTASNSVPNMPANNSASGGNSNSSTSTSATGGGDGVSSGGDYAWVTRMSAESIEAFVKGSKSRLDQVVSTPAKFASGAYEDSRREFTLLTLMFTVIEKYPSEVRWQKSAAVARHRFAKAAAASKVGSSQAFQEAKGALQDLADMLNGGQMAGEAPEEEEGAWGDLIDRSITMQIMEDGLREHLMTGISNASEFADKSDQLLQHAEFLALSGEILKLPGMSDADDKEYVKWCDQMIEHANTVTEAVKNKQLEGARSGIGLIDQTCTKCHEGYR